MTNKILVLVRHGESTWNSENRFTGWTDVPLSAHGEKEALEAADMLKEKNIKFDVAYTSVLKRAIHTCWSILKNTDQTAVPITNTWRLNERHYGELQGLNKSETAAKHGEAQVKIWRRAYDIAPPPLPVDDSRNARFESKYHGVPSEVLPATECLKDTIARVLPYYFDEIAPALLQDKCVLVCAHGNSLRGLVKHLDKISDDAIVELNIPTAVPLVYELDDNLKPVKKYYLLSDEQVQERIAAVANQGKAK